VTFLRLHFSGRLIPIHLHIPFNQCLPVEPDHGPWLQTVILAEVCPSGMEWIVRSGDGPTLCPGRNTSNTFTTAAPAPAGSMVEASGFKFSEKDTKPGKVKVKKGGTGTGKGKKKNKAGMLINNTLRPKAIKKERI
jgi:hypothetical protein